MQVSQHPQCVVAITSGPPSRAALYAASAKTQIPSHEQNDADGHGPEDQGDGKTFKFKFMGVVVSAAGGVCMHVCSLCVRSFTF